MRLLHASSCALGALQAQSVGASCLCDHRLQLLPVMQVMLWICMQDSSQTSQWNVPQTTTAVVVKMLKPGEDETVQVSSHAMCLSQHRTYL